MTMNLTITTPRLMPNPPGRVPLAMMKQVNATTLAELLQKTGMANLSVN